MKWSTCIPHATVFASLMDLGSSPAGVGAVCSSINLKTGSEIRGQQEWVWGLLNHTTHWDDSESLHTPSVKGQSVSMLWHAVYSQLHHHHHNIRAWWIPDLLISLYLACLSATVPDNGGRRERSFSFSFWSTLATRVESLLVNSPKLNSLSSALTASTLSAAANIFLLGTFYVKYALITAFDI